MRKSKFYFHKLHYIDVLVYFLDILNKFYSFFSFDVIKFGWKILLIWLRLSEINSFLKNCFFSISTVNCFFFFFLLKFVFFSFNSQEIRILEFWFASTSHSDRMTCSNSFFHNLLKGDFPKDYFLFLLKIMQIVKGLRGIIRLKIDIERLGDPTSVETRCQCVYILSLLTWFKDYFCYVYFLLFKS